MEPPVPAPASRRVDPGVAGDVIGGLTTFLALSAGLLVVERLAG